MREKHSAEAGSEQVGLPVRPQGVHPRKPLASCSEGRRATRTRVGGEKGLGFRRSGRRILGPEQLARALAEPMAKP